NRLDRRRRDRGKRGQNGRSPFGRRRDVPKTKVPGSGTLRTGSEGVQQLTGSLLPSAAHYIHWRIPSFTVLPHTFAAYRVSSRHEVDMSLNYRRSAERAAIPSARRGLPLPSTCAIRDSA